MENCFMEWEEYFGDRWKEVRRILSYLQGLGIWYVGSQASEYQLWRLTEIIRMLS